MRNSAGSDKKGSWTARQAKMKREQVSKLAAQAAFITATIFFLFVNTCGATRTRPNTDANSASRVKETSKPVYRQSNRITAGPSTFTPEMPFGEAIDILRNSSEPPLNIVVLWKDLLANAEIDRDTPIGMDGISGVPLRKHLELLLLSVSAGSLAELGYAVEKGVIIIATKDSLPTKMKTRVYDITGLASAPANYFMPPMGFGGMMPYGGYGGAYGGYGTPYGGMRPYAGTYGGLGYGDLYGGASYMGTYGGGYRGAYRGPYGSSGASGIGNPYGFSRAGELAGLIDTLYGLSGRGPYRRNSRTR